MPAPQPRMHGLTHIPGGADPIPGLMIDPGGSLYDLADGVWPLNETSGTVAHDVSGNNHHLTSVRSAIVWGQPAGPPGTLTPEIHKDRLAWNAANGTLLAGAADNFSAAAWMYATDRNQALAFMGFGAPIHSLSHGWQIGQDNSSYKIRVDWAAGTATILGDAALPQNVWYLVGISREAGVMKLYVNGVAQAATSATAPTVDGTASFWLGSDDYNYPAGTFSLDGRLSYAAYWGTRALTAAEHLELYNHPGVGGPDDGDVWTSDGAGGASWEEPTAASDPAKVDRDAVETATARLVQVKLLAGDTQPTLKITGDGKLQWGPGGTTAPDTNLYRDNVNRVKTDGAVWSVGDMQTSGDIYARVTGTGRVRLTAGPAGTGAILFSNLEDTILYRSAGNVLKTDGNFHVGNELSNKPGTAQQILLGNDGRIYFGSAGATVLYPSSGGIAMTFGGLGNRDLVYGAADSAGTGFRTVRIAN